MSGIQDHPLSPEDAEEYNRLLRIAVAPHPLQVIKRVDAPDFSYDPLQSNLRRYDENLRRIVQEQLFHPALLPEVLPLASNQQWEILQYQCQQVFPIKLEWDVMPPYSRSSWCLTLAKMLYCGYYIEEVLGVKDYVAGTLLHEFNVPYRYEYDSPKLIDVRLAHMCVCTVCSVFLTYESPEEKEYYLFHLRRTHAFWQQQEAARAQLLEETQVTLAEEQHSSVESYGLLEDLTIDDA